ncbi:MAG TPA: HEAT repeat domain-containing protein [candidate division Zixibacteria bacterium]|nr:HEAT repeat domain-containing protein [candidate division Zixibacteria bacterium]MDD4916243.1 HEAT repeat domain-containing protein [candidate division Zixibacteria bacterium]HOD67162.1 HEAT repeat domain-containing protein [candidate division Zixibacteria bacterium]
MFSDFKNQDTLQKPRTASDGRASHADPAARRPLWRPGGRVRTLIGGLLLVIVLAPALSAQIDLQHRIDSLFVIASSGEVRYQKLTGPAMDSIAAFGQPAVPYLIDKFDTKSARDRWTIIWILQRIGSPAVPDLVRALDRADPLVVSRVAWALGDIKDTGAVLPLIAKSTHAAWQVREETIGSLGDIGDRRGDNAILAALGDSIGQVRKAAAVAAGRLKILEAAAPLVHRFGDPFYGARLAAVDALLQLDTVLSLPVLIDSLASADAFVSALSAAALGRIGADRALDALFRQATEDPDPARRVPAACALIEADPLDRCRYREKLLAAQPDRLGRLKVESALKTARHVEKGTAQ